MNLRGNARTKGEQRKKEKDNVFGQNSKTPIAITFLIKHNKEKNSNKPANIYYYDIGDYLLLDAKLDKIKKFKSVNGIEWEEKEQDQHGDWLNQRDSSFKQFLLLGDRRSENTLFNLYKNGVSTNRDSWAYNFNESQVQENMKRMITFYNSELERLKNIEINTSNIDQMICSDKRKIKWSSSLKNYFIKRIKGNFNENCIRVSSYRPFTKSYLYFDRLFTHRTSQKEIFSQPSTENQVIYISGIGAKAFSVLITDCIPDLQYLFNGQCFPFYYFDEDGNKKENITDQTLETFRSHYKDNNITKWNVFYYIYGLLHSRRYQEKYQNDLSKELPRIPFAPGFQLFSSLGKNLADLHLNYETQGKPNAVRLFKNKKQVSLSQLTNNDLKVTKMRIDKQDKSKIIFNDVLTISGIPENAWDYKINEWSAIQWIVEIYRRNHQRSLKIGIVNDANTYSNDPAYILKLLFSIITVSIETKKIVDALSSHPFTDK